MENCWGFVATKVHHRAQGDLFMKQTPPPELQLCSVHEFMLVLWTEIAIFSFVSSNSRFKNIFEFNMSISEWSSYTGGSADVKWSKKDLLDRIEEGENLSETSANGLNFMHVACRQGQVFTVP